MIVCHCLAVSDREIRRAARSGACQGADVARACGAGSVCGGCGPTIDEIVAEEHSAEHADASTLPLGSAPAR